VAQADAKSRCDAVSAKSKLDVAAANPVDVIKPKVVRTEIIATPNSSPAPARPVGNFEPARIAPPPVQAVAKPATAEPALKVELASVPLPRVRPELAVKVEFASIPLPPVRPEFASVPKPAAQPHAAERIKRADRKSIDAKSKTASKKTEPANPDDPVGVVSFLKKLVTPDKKSPKLTEEAQADPPSQMQAPQ
jgi:hypothetical protein